MFLLIAYSFDQIGDLNIIKNNLKVVLVVSCIAQCFSQVDVISQSVIKYDISYVQGQDQTLWIDFLARADITVVSQPLVLSRRTL